MNASRNLAIAQAQGEFITFLDSDDLWLPHRLDAFRARAAQSPQAGFLFSNAWVWRFERIRGRSSTRPDPSPRGSCREIRRGRPAPSLRDDQRRYPARGLHPLETVRTEMKTLDTELFTRFLARGLPVAALH